jgi:hypothetical protein
MWTPALYGRPDLKVQMTRSFSRAADKQRLVVSHDHRTMTAAARKRIRQGVPMAGLILFRQDCPLSLATEELELVSEATTAEEWRNVIAFLPL